MRDQGAWLIRGQKSVQCALNEGGSNSGLYLKESNGFSLGGGMLKKSIHLVPALLNVLVNQGY